MCEFINEKQKHNIPFRNAQKICPVFCGICVTHSFVFYVVFCSKQVDIIYIYDVQILLRVTRITFIRLSHSQMITKLTVLKNIWEEVKQRPKQEVKIG